MEVYYFTSIAHSQLKHTRKKRYGSFEAIWLQKVDNLECILDITSLPHEYKQHRRVGKPKPHWRFEVIKKTSPIRWDVKVVSLLMLTQMTGSIYQCDTSFFWDRALMRLFLSYVGSGSCYHNNSLVGRSMFSCMGRYTSVEFPIVMSKGTSGPLYYRLSVLDSNISSRGVQNPYRPVQVYRQLHPPPVPPTLSPPYQQVISLHGSSIINKVRGYDTRH